MAKKKSVEMKRMMSGMPKSMPMGMMDGQDMMMKSSMMTKTKGVGNKSKKK